jgi:hypothetical protein
MENPPKQQTPFAEYVQLLEEQEVLRQANPQKTPEMQAKQARADYIGTHQADYNVTNSWEDRELRQRLDNLLNSNS